MITEYQTYNFIPSGNAILMGRMTSQPRPHEVEATLFSLKRKQIIPGFRVNLLNDLKSSGKLRCLVSSLGVPKRDKRPKIAIPPLYRLLASNSALLSYDTLIKYRKIPIDFAFSNVDLGGLGFFGLLNPIAHIFPKMESLWKHATHTKKAFREVSRFFSEIEINTPEEFQLYLESVVEAIAESRSAEPIPIVEDDPDPEYLGIVANIEVTAKFESELRTMSISDLVSMLDPDEAPPLEENETEEDYVARFDNRWDVSDGEDMEEILLDNELRRAHASLGDMLNDD
jgi:hypothetical protein